MPDLLSLPPEIRLSIWAFCLPFLTFERRIWLGYGRERYGGLVRLLLVCKQISAETSEMVYRKAEFKASCFGWYSFNLGREDGFSPLKLLEHVEISGHTKEWDWTSLACLPNIKHLTLEINLRLFQYTGGRRYDYSKGIVSGLQRFSSLKSLRVIFCLPEIQRIRLKDRPARLGWECQLTGKLFEDTEIPYDSTAIFCNMTAPMTAMLEALPSNCKVTWIADDSDKEECRYYLHDKTLTQIAHNILKNKGGY